MSCHEPCHTDEARFAIRGINVCESLLRHTPRQIESLFDRMAGLGLNTLLMDADQVVQGILACLSGCVGIPKDGKS